MAKAQWYVKQKSGRIQGAFMTSQIHELLILGRLKGDELVFREGQPEEPLSQVPELVPEELLTLHPYLEEFNHD